ncbi:DUF2087 domain-containing protein [Peribacillus frigoritolerans]|nr:DUF2087 domain-containing protein [Peribacillus frigoritolerans]
MEAFWKRDVNIQKKELNEFIQSFHDDYATIRRELIIGSIMYRENSIYELNPAKCGLISVNGILK